MGSMASQDTAFVAVLRSCARQKNLCKGFKVHADILKSGLLDKSSFVVDALIRMYAKCGALSTAQSLLDGLAVRDVVSWTALIAGYAQQGQGQNALNCFEQMLQEGVSPDAVTFTCLLKACGSIGAADKGEQIRNQVVEMGLLQKNVELGNALVDMYAKFGALAKAQEVLEQLPVRDVISWNAIIAGYAQQGQGKDALDCLDQMRREGLSPDAVTFTCILKACGSIGAAEKGERIHEEIAKQGLLGKNILLSNALVGMYTKCGALLKAQRVLEALPARNAYSWNALIAGYTQRGQNREALDCFEQMQHEGLSPDVVTFTCILKACSSLGAADKGEQIHDEIAKQGLLEKDIVLCTALVDMYAKCGVLAKAQQLLEELPVRDVVSWSALIAGYAQQGQPQDVLICFQRMQGEGLPPNAVTFSSVLYACSHSGLVKEGQTFFVNMSAKFGVVPVLEHYTCMVALFGHAGHLDKAVGVIQRMPFSGYSAVWSALLGACRKWGDVNVGRWSFEHAIQVDQSDATPYVCMASIYAAAGMQEDAELIEVMRVKNKAWRKSGFSGWIDISTTKHTQSPGNYIKLEHIAEKFAL